MDVDEVSALLDRDEDAPVFPVVVERFVASRGVESFEELYRRFLQTEHAYIPVPGLHRGKPVSFEEFKRHISAERTYLYGEVISGLTEALGMERPRDDKEIAALTLAYVLGRKPLRLRPEYAGKL